MNDRNFQTNPDYPATDKVLRFVVGTSTTSSNGNGDIPSHLSDLAIPNQQTTIDETFEFGKSNGGQWLINGIGFEDVKNRVVAYPSQGKTQRWRLVNKGGGKCLPVFHPIYGIVSPNQITLVGWSHPIHIHLIDFQVVARTGSGRQGVTPYEAAALKDIVYLGTNGKLASS